MDFVNTFWALVPPIIAIGLALITKEVYSSLFVGILVGALLVNGFAPVATLDTVISDGLVAGIEGNAGIFLFLVLLGIIGQYIAVIYTELKDRPIYIIKDIR